MHASDSIATVVAKACVDYNSNSGYHGILPINQQTKEGSKKGRMKGGREGGKEGTNK